MNQTKTSKSKLKPLDFKEENEKFKAFNERKEIKFEKCKHKDVKYKEGKLICPCGASWSGSRLAELFDFFTKKR